MLIIKDYGYWQLNYKYPWLMVTMLFWWGVSPGWAQTFVQEEPQESPDLTRNEFEKNIHRYIPGDLSQYTLVVEKYTCLQIFELHRRANLLALYQSGLDTIKVSPPYPDWEEYDEVKTCKQMLKIEDRKMQALKKKYRYPVKFSWGKEIENLDENTYRYLLKRHIHSTMYHPKLKYYTTHLHYIYDRKTHKIFMKSRQFDILEWIIKDQ